MKGTKTFYSGLALILSGVAAHIPMFYRASSNDYVMVGMEMGGLMWLGMVFIFLGVVVSFRSLLTRDALHARDYHYRLEAISFTRMDDSSLSSKHVWTLAVLTIAVIVDVMKPATLGLVIPGMRLEYGLSRLQVSIFPVVALIGTAVGSVTWGLVADKMGRKATIILSALLFIGTSICGTMPTFTWNTIMCFLMGMSAGGLLPITFILLAEIMPSRHRGWSMVAVGGLGTTLGYFLATFNAHIMEPLFGWRSLWFAGTPSGVALILLNRFIPESPRFLVKSRRIEEAKTMMDSFGVSLRIQHLSDQDYAGNSEEKESSLTDKSKSNSYSHITLALILCGASWGLVNYGFILWLPDTLRNSGVDPGYSSQLLSKSALFALPGVVAAALLYHFYSTHKTLILFTIICLASLASFTFYSELIRSGWAINLSLIVLLASSSGVISALLPYSAEIYPQHIRATNSGIIAGASKAGGVVGASFGVVSVLSSVGVSAFITALPVFLSLLLLYMFSFETRGETLESISKRGSKKIVHKQVDVPKDGAHIDNNLFTE